jgi:excisionase family DNA binding protein
MHLDQIVRKLVEETVELRLETFRQSLIEQMCISQNPYLTRQEAASYLGVCLASLDNYVRSGRIEKFKAGRKTLFRREDLQRLPV